MTTGPRGVFGGGRVREVLGSVQSPCPLCRSAGPRLVIESRDRHGLRNLLSHDLHARTYVLCEACGARTDATGETMIELP